MPSAHGVAAACGSPLFAPGALRAARSTRQAFDDQLHGLLESLAAETNASAPGADSESEAAWPTMRARPKARFDLLGPVGPSCLHREAFGQPVARGRLRDFERKWMCSAGEAAGAGGWREGCAVVSMGSNGQFGFEADVVRRTPCRVEVFDCTVGPDVRVPAELASRVRLHRFCIGPQPAERRSQLYDWARRRYVRQRAQLSFVSYRRALALAGLDAAPAYLKMDIEGYEWSLAAQLVRQPSLAPAQLAVEVHLTTHMPGLPWAGRLKSPAEAVAFGVLLARAGYHIVSREDSPVCHWCTELLLVRDPCANASRPGAASRAARRRPRRPRWATRRGSRRRRRRTRRRPAPRAPSRRRGYAAARGAPGAASPPTSRARAC